MKKLKLIGFLSVGLFVIFLVFLACQSSNINPADANQFNSDIMAVLEGSNYSAADDGVFSIAKDQRGNILRGDFKLDNKKINFEIYRGNKIIDEIRKLNPDFPEYEIDIRFLDKNGFPFFIQVGGHDPKNVGWESSLKFDNKRSVEEKSRDAQESFGLAKKMIESLNKLRFRNDFVPEYEAIVGIKAIIESGLVVQRIEDLDIEDADRKLNHGGTDVHQIEIWKRPAFTPYNLLYDHSATLFRVISSNGCSYQIWSSSNHGTPPGGSGMTKKCTKSFPNRQGFSQQPPECSSIFQFDPSRPKYLWPLNNGTHLCNDDSYVQYYRIKYNINPDLVNGTCSDNNFNGTAPDCW